MNGLGMVRRMWTTIHIEAFGQDVSCVGQSGQRCEVVRIREKADHHLTVTGIFLEI